MTIWWASLTGLEQVLLYVAVPATLLLLIQTILLFLGGMGGGDTDADDGHLDLSGHADLSGDSPDASADLHDDGDAHDGHAAAGLHVLTLRGIVAFLTLFSWGGLWLSHLGLRPFWALFLGIQLGIVGMVGIALVLREAIKLQQDGTLDLRNAVGRSGSVYLTVPPQRSGPGKVNVLVQEQFWEFEAVTDSETPIPTGAEVEIVGLVDDEILLVAPK